jgi:predicted enzyme related to lactoylglutathione lyase
MELIINIDVDDIGRGIAFYTHGLGLRLKRTLFGGAVAELEGGSSIIQLLCKVEGSTTGAQTRRYTRHWTPVHLDFCVDDLEAAVARAIQAGARLERGIDAFDWGSIASLSDPFGHGLCLMRLTPSGYALHADAPAQAG